MKEAGRRRQGGYGGLCAYRPGFSGNSRISQLFTSVKRIQSVIWLLSRYQIVLALALLCFGAASCSSGLVLKILLVAAGIFTGLFLGGVLLHSAVLRRIKEALVGTAAPARPRIPDIIREIEALSHRAQDAAQEAFDAQQRYQVLTDNLAAAIVVRSPQGRIVFLSSYAEVLTGYSLHEMYGAAGDFFETIVREDDRPLYRRSLRMGEIGEAFQCRYRITHSSGIEMWVESRTVPIHGESSEVELLLSILLDVTAQVRYQQQVEEKNRDLHDFSYMVSHDLKAPIATIKGMLFAFRQEFGQTLQETQAEYFGHIERATKRLEQLVSSVLEYARVSGTTLELTDLELGAVIEEVCGEFHAAVKNVGGAIHVEPIRALVQGDRLMLYQVFANLLSNALKYRDPVRTLEIRVREMSPATSQHVRIGIEDNGLGIPEDKRDVIFRPFQRIHREVAEGSGIGLASVKRVLEKIGGSISVTSVVGQGSLFVVELPRARADSRSRKT